MMIASEKQGHEEQCELLLLPVKSRAMMRMEGRIMMIASENEGCDEQWKKVPVRMRDKMRM